MRGYITHSPLHPQAARRVNASTHACDLLTRARAGLCIHAYMRACDLANETEEGSRRRRRRKKTTITLWRVVAEGWRHYGRTVRPVAMEKRQRGNEILRIARRWKEMRQNMHEGEGDNLRAMSLTHDDDDYVASSLLGCSYRSRAV